MTDALSGGVFGSATDDLTDLRNLVNVLDRHVILLPLVALRSRAPGGHAMIEIKRFPMASR